MIASARVEDGLGCPAMKMRIIIAVLSFTALMWLEPANAQKMYAVTVSVHEEVQNGQNVRPLTADEVQDILADASRLFQKDATHPETEDDVRCDVSFALKGEVTAFKDPSSIVKPGELDAVHGIRPDVDADFHVKVVESIMNFCRFPGKLFNGCAFPPHFRSIIVVHPDFHVDRNRNSIPRGKYPDDRLWAHEFGHLTGLGHRDDERALMTSCPLNEQLAKFPDRAQVRVSRHECTCLRWGPGFGPNGTCDLRGPVEQKCGS
jgi:hypothetical protein